MADTVTFHASLPPIKSAMMLDGNGDGGQIKLDVPGSDAGALVLLHQFCTGKPLLVTVEVLEKEVLNVGTVSRRTAKRRKQ